MKTKFKVLLLVSVLMCSSCVTTDHERAEQGKRINIAEQQNSILQTEMDEIKDHASSLSYGVGKSLEKEQSPSLAVKIAIQLNERVKILLGNPSMEEMIKTEKMVDDLTSAIEKERKNGESLLKEKDKEIFKTNADLAKLKEKYLELEKDYKNTAEKAAVDADKYGQIVKIDNSWFGLGGVFRGLKRFGFWMIGFGSLFFLLRFASTFSPVASAIFGAFEGIFSMIIKFVGWIIPGAFKLSGWVGHELYNSLKGSHEQIVDTLQSMKEDQLKNPTKIYTLNDILNALAKDMTDSEKNQVEEALKVLRWKD